MPVVITGTEVERGPHRWRARTSGLDGDGPEDKVLVIEFSGNLATLPGLRGHRLDISELRQGCSLVNQAWIPATGSFPCQVQRGMTHVIIVSFAAA